MQLDAMLVLISCITLILCAIEGKKNKELYDKYYKLQLKIQLPLVFILGFVSIYFGMIDNLKLSSLFMILTYADAIVPNVIILLLLKANKS